MPFLDHAAWAQSHREQGRVQRLSSALCSGAVHQRTSSNPFSAHVFRGASAGDPSTRPVKTAERTKQPNRGGEGRMAPSSCGAFTDQGGMTRPHTVLD